MKKIISAMIAVFIAAMLFSCGDASSDPLAYQTGNITAEIAILKNGCRIGAALRISESGDITMTLTSPESVMGTEIKRTDGEVSITRGTVSSNASAYLAAAELFHLDGNVTSSETAEIDGKKLTKICVSSDSGIYEVWLSENNTPARIASDSLTVDVVWFERDQKN